MDYAQETVTLRVQTITYNANDDPVRSNTDSSISAVPQIMTLDDVQEMGGELEVGDAVFFVKHDVTISKGNIIIHNSISYEIIKIIPEYSDGNLVFQECHARRYEYA